VDTLRGTRRGVPSLCHLLREHDIRATFFFTVGPDNMGRHLWRMFKPAFLWKMLRTRAASLYGWDILLRGTLWPGPVIAGKVPQVIRDAANAGHEIGLHAWDHHAWQAHVEDWSPQQLQTELQRGYDALTEVIGRPPTCAASPGWRCTNAVLAEKERLPFTYNSDCRGANIFMPVVDGQVLRQPQVPITLPTYDELLGTHGITDQNYNDRILSLLAEDRLNVLTIHAEVEGISHRDLFGDFVARALKGGIEFVPLGELLPVGASWPEDTIELRKIPGREGVLACQASSL
jgi:undecaprenyl phosphate-alpha-L-ara4FN deformylase